MMAIGLALTLDGNAPVTSQEPVRVQPKPKKKCFRPECDNTITYSSQIYCSARCCKTDKLRLKVLNLDREKQLKPQRHDKAGI